MSDGIRDDLADQQRGIVQALHGRSPWTSSTSVWRANEGAIEEAGSRVIVIRSKRVSSFTCPSPPERTFTASMAGQSGCDHARAGTYEPVGEVAGRSALGVRCASGGVSQPDDDPTRDTGNGNDAASDSTASRAARQTAPCLDHHRSLHAPPGPDDLALDEEGAGPDTRCPELAPTGRVGDQDRAIDSLEEEERVAAREEPGGRDGPRGGGTSGSSRVRIHASPTGVRTGVTDLRSRSNAAQPPAG